MTREADTSGAPPTGEELDDLLERALGLAPGASRRGPVYDPPPTPSPVPRGSDGVGRRVGRGRLLAGVALVTVLAAGSVLLGAVGGRKVPSGEASAVALQPPEPAAAGSLPPGTDAATTAGRSAPRPPDLLGRLPASLAARCREAPGLDLVAVEAVVCTPGGKVSRLELRSFASSDALLARYRAVAGGEEGAGGGPRCASGDVEERAWAAASAPDRRAGRYACRAGDAAGSGAAVLWWSSEASLVIGRAVGADDDLAGLFDWWRSAPESLIAPARAS